MINIDFYFFVSAGIFLGLSQPIINNANAQISNNWFDPSEV